MKNSIILPFEENPYTQMFHHSAFPLGIIQGNAKEDIDPWLATQYINCLFLPGKTFEILTEDDWFIDDGKLIKQRIAMVPDLYKSLSIDYLDLIREMLSRGCYVEGSYNEEHISGKWSYQKTYFPHDYLLTGFDNDQEIFYSVGYLADGKFQKFTIPYDCMAKSLATLRRTDMYFNFWKYNEDATYEFDMSKMLRELYHYLHSTVSAKSFYTTVHFGIQVFYELAKYFLSTAEKQNHIDLRYTRGILEHKFIMTKRIDYLSKITDIDFSEFQEKSKQVYKIAERVHLLTIKFLIKRDQSIVKNMEALIHEMLAIEKEYLPKLYDSMLETQKQGVPYGRK